MLNRFCIDCGKSIISPKAIRCRSCASKFMWAKPESKFKASQSALKVAKEKPSLRKFRSDMQKLVNTPELKIKKSLLAKQMWNDPNTRQRMVDGIAKASAKGNNKPSNLELRVGACLTDLNLTYKSQFRPRGIHRYYDFYLVDMGLIIEVDGDYWHHSERALSEGVELIDDYKTAWALANGYNLLRLRECDLIAIGISEHVNDGLCNVSRALSNSNYTNSVYVRYSKRWLVDSAIDVVQMYNALYLIPEDMHA